LEKRQHPDRVAGMGVSGQTIELGLRLINHASRTPNSSNV
jgi:hypothetical protein